MQAKVITYPSQPKGTVTYLVILSLLACLFLILLTNPVLASAPQNSDMGYVLCTILSWMSGNMGKGLASLAIVILGVGAVLGKTSWGLALTVAMGIVAIFNSEYIVELLLRNTGASYLFC